MRLDEFVYREYSRVNEFVFRCGPVDGFASIEAFPLRAASELDRAAVASLLSAAKLAALDSAAQFGPQYVVAVDASGILAGVAGLEIYGAMLCCVRSPSRRG